MNSYDYWIEIVYDDSSDDDPIRLQGRGYHWRICAGNGQIVCHSEQYSTLWNCRRAARKMHKVTGLRLYEEVRSPLHRR